MITEQIFGVMFYTNLSFITYSVENILKLVKEKI